MTKNPVTSTVWGGFAPPRATLLVAAICLGLYLLAGPAWEPLLLTREGLGSGEFWRLMTGHLIHCDPGHLAWNLGALILLGSVYEEIERPSLSRFVAELGACGLAVGLAVVAFAPHLDAYCGLSGALNGLYVLALGAMWRATRSPLVLLSGIGDLGKIAVESAIDHALFTSTAWPPVPVAHMAGFAAGAFILAAGFLSSWPRFSVPRP